MRIRPIAAALLVIGGLAGPGRGWAQGGVFTVAFTVGARARIDSLDVHSRGKLEEYRAVPTGAVFRALRLDYAPAGGVRTWKLVAREVGERDQSAWAGVNQPGRWNALLRWDRIPHTFSSTARSLGAEDVRGVFTLPTPRPDTASWNRAPYLDATRTRWDPVRASVSFTPTEHWDLKAEYTWIGKTGDRPMGMAFGSPGNNFREILEPIDQTVQSLRLQEGYSGKRYQLLFTYDFSHFSNDFPSAISDNPLVTTDGATTGPARGRTALAPGNLAHTVMLTGAVSLPWHTRINGTASLGWRRQNQAFLPPTINSAITSPAFSGIPPSLDGRERTTLLNLAASSRPIRRVTLTGRLRHYRLSDQTDVPELIPFVLNDRTLTVPGEETFRVPYGKDNADLSATWHFVGPASLIGGYSFERWERAAPVRNTRHTNEHAGRIGLNLDASGWLQVRGTFTASRRRIVGEYLAVTEDQLPTLRRFDQADRDRYRWEVQTGLSPTDQLTLTGLFGAGRADYVHSEFGLQLERSILAGGEAEWSPNERVSLGASYTREEFRSRQRSKYREPSQLANPTYDWVSNNNDFIDTFGANFTAVVKPGRLEVGGMLELSKARLVNIAYNPTTPTGGTATQNASAAAGNWPDITQKWVPASAYAEYRVTADWSATVRYTYDQFDKADFRTDGLKPATGADIFLGNDYRDYNGQFLTFTISYRPRLLGVGRSAL